MESRETDVAIFIDTNIVLHATPFENVKWSEHARFEPAKTVRLVLCSEVLRELDDNCYDERRDRAHQERARQRRTAITSVLLGRHNLPGGTSIETCATPTDLRRDAALLHAVKSWTSCRAILATNDAFLIERARAEAIVTVQLPEREPVTSSRASMDKIREDLVNVARRLSELENTSSARPKLSAAFDDGGTELNWKRPSFRVLTDDDLLRQKASLLASDPDLKRGGLSEAVARWAKEERQKRSHEAKETTIRILVRNTSNATTADDVQCSFELHHGPEVSVYSGIGTDAWTDATKAGSVIQLKDVPPLNPNATPHIVNFRLIVKDENVPDFSIILRGRVTARNTPSVDILSLIHI